MGIIYGYYLFKKNKGVLNPNLKDSDLNYLPEHIRKHVLESTDCPARNLKTKVGIGVRWDHSIEEMIKTYIHELLHVAYHYNFQLDSNKKRGNININPLRYPLTKTEAELEKGMNKIAEDIYNSQPRLVEILRKEILSLS